MGLFTFTNITCFVFFIYLALVGKNFYDIFFPTVCDESDKNARCIKQVYKWESNYKVLIDYFNQQILFGYFNHSSYLDLSLC